MFKNYLKVALRTMAREKGPSFINIAGLALGMACFIVMLLLVTDELSFNRSHQNADRIYRVLVEDDTKYNGPIGITEAPLAAALKKDFPEISESACYNHGGGGLVKTGDKVFEERYFTFTDPEFFKMFTFTFLKGSPQSALEDPLGVILSEKTAEKYFGDQDPLGKIMEIKDVGNLTVTGVIQTPKNSSFRMDFVVSNQLYKKYSVDISDWNTRNYVSFIMLRDKASADGLRAKIADYYVKRYPESKARLLLQPLTRIHLYSGFTYEILRTSSIYALILIAFPAVFILLIACVNFMNLTTSRSAQRMKEVGMRKVVGADRRQLIRQFLGESILLAFIALFFAIALVELALPQLNRLLLKELSLYASLSPAMFLGLIAISLVTGGIAGSYPAFFLSSFNPVQVLKGAGQKGAKGSLLRKILVIGQFAVSIFFIIAVTILYKQLYYIQHTDLGFDKEHVACVQMNPEIITRYDALKSALLKEPGIINVTAALNLPGWAWPSYTESHWEGKTDDRSFTLHHCAVDYDYFETLKMKLKGRSFSREFPSDLTSALIINEETARQMHIDNPLGKHFGSGSYQGEIIGVVKDFHFNDLRNKIAPLVIKLAPQNTKVMMIRVAPNSIPGSVAAIERQWKDFTKDYPFNYIFLEDHLARLYMPEKVIGTVMTVFTFFAIFISCMGLFSLASYMTERRTKEIGIRKTFGSSAFGIVQLLSREFLKWILVANLIAWPIAFLLMSKFLQIYALRITIDIDPFLWASGSALLITLLSVGYQSLKAARTRPAKALRSE